MLKKIFSIIFLVSSLLTGFINNNQFDYRYEVIAASNSPLDLMNLYIYKEYLIDEYNDLINYLDPSIHEESVKANIAIFAKDGSVARYEDGKIIVYIGDAKGARIGGDLKKEACSNDVTRIKFYFSEFFFS